MRKIAFAVIALATVSLFARTASAQTLVVQEYASGSAITCVPLGPTTWPVPWVQTHGKVLHNGSALQDVVLFCPVALTAVPFLVAGPAGTVGQPPKVFTVKYVDPDGTGTQANVLAELKYADAGGNMIEMAVASSSAQSSNATGISTMDANISSFDSSGGHMFVQLTLHRTSTGLFPAVYGFTLH